MRFWDIGKEEKRVLGIQTQPGPDLRPLRAMYRLLLSLSVSSCWTSLFPLPSTLSLGLEYVFAIERSSLSE